MRAMSSPYGKRTGFLLAVDIGNTNAVIGLFRGLSLIRHWRVATGAQKTQDEFALLLESLLASSRVGKEEIGGVIICSVVPATLAVWRRVVLHLLGLKPRVVGEDVRVPLKNRYRDPSQVGQDRLVNALAVHRRFKGPAIIVDFGTATTFDVLSSKGEYLGGLIVPGVEISLQALSERAALLPRIVLEAPRELIGRDTVTSMRSGILHGYGSLTDGLIAKVRREIGPKARFYATGGAAPLVLPYCRTPIRLEPHLTLEGLALLHSL